MSNVQAYPHPEFTPGMCPNCARMVAQLMKLSRLLEEIAYLASTHHVRAADPEPR